MHASFSTSSPTQKHIAIVGSGLVGSLLAIYLARRGYRVSVFEKRNQQLIGGSSETRRSVNLALSNRGLQSLKELGLLDLLQNKSVPMYGRMMHDIHQQLTYQPYSYDNQCIYSIERKTLNIALIEEASKEYGISFHHNHQCKDVDFEKTMLTLDHKKSTRKEQFDIIIGVDGAFSVIRKAMYKVGMEEHEENFLGYGYKELEIPANKNKQHAINVNALHIWPRKHFMFIALPNPKNNFTCTLFLPLKGENSFEEINTPDKARQFFTKNFPDASTLMPKLEEQFDSHPTSLLGTLKCFPWVRNNILLLGDAAHSMTPFYGQGMNAGFEDCHVLCQLLHQHNDDWKTILPAFQKIRKPDNDAIGQLALDNFIEMRTLVGNNEFLLQKKIEAKLHMMFPTRWIPLYTMITFREDIRYSEAYAKGMIQKKIIEEVMRLPHIEKKWETIDYEAIVSKLDETIACTIS